MIIWRFNIHRRVKSQFSTEHKYPAGFIHSCIQPTCSKQIFNFLSPRDYRLTGAAFKLVSGSRRSEKIYVKINYKMFMSGQTSLTD